MARMRIRLPLLSWVVLALILLGLVPFVVSWYQIDRGLEGIVRQTQATHLIIARTVADRSAELLNGQRRQLENLGRDPGFYRDPQSQQAADVLSNGLMASPELALIAAVQEAESGDIQLVQLARRKDSAPGLPGQVEDPAWQDSQLIVAGSTRLLQVSAPAARPGVQLRALASLGPLDQALTPIELGGDARLALIGTDGEVIAGDPLDFQQLPANIQQQLTAPQTRSGATRYRLGKQVQVAAFAAVPGTAWRVVSTQPAQEAETAASEMRSSAWGGITLAAIAVLLIAAGATRFVIAPIRRLISTHGQLMGASHQRLEGSEIAQLQAAFSRLSDTLQDRDKIGSVFLGRYQVLRRIGTGSMGTVFLGWDPKLRRRLALKTVKLQAFQRGAHEPLTESLLREATAAAQLNHPNIVTIFDIVGDDNEAFLAMEFVHGESMREMLSRRGPIPADEVRNLARQLLTGLAAAHAEHIIHRDIKPENILIDESGRAKLTDFGIAAANLRVKESMVIGTLGYLAPECLKLQYSERSDLFAAGMTLFESLCNYNPLHTRHTDNPIQKTRHSDVQWPSEVLAQLPDDLLQLITLLTQKDPAQRPQSASAALSEMDRLREESGIGDTIKEQQLRVAVDYSLALKEPANDQTTTIREYFTLHGDSDER